MGLVTAMFLAADGHEVTVLERDPMAPPPPDEAWETWERRGVNQFRLPHFLIPRFRHEMARHLPRVLDALEAAGAHQLSFFGPFREAVPDPERFDVVTARRPIVEAVIAAETARTPGISIRRGVGIAGLRTGAEVAPGIPHVTGVRTESGEEVTADLVVAATGRRSPLGRWLAEIGARPPLEEQEDCGFVYYGRYVRTDDGSPVVPGPESADFGSVGLLALPADQGTAGVAIITATGDAATRGLRDETAWGRVLRALPGGDRLAELEPISEHAVMAGIEDRWRRFAVDGEPVATGVVAVADAWAATNPTLGRGISLGVIHARHLRDLVRTHLDQPRDLAVAWDELTDREMTPWYRATVWHDRRKARQYAVSAGLAEDVPDPDWDRFVALGAAAQADLELAVRFAERQAFLLEPPEALLADDDLAAKLDAAPVDWRHHAGPSRAEVLALLAG